MTKKISSKAAKQPAPAAKSSAKSTAKASTKKSAAAPATEIPAAAAAPATTVAEVVSSVIVTPEVSPIATKPRVTTITAKVDTGFGNFLTLRGDGAGLSWDRGVMMTCVGPDEWQTTLPESSRPVAFKFLINDTTWSIGPDFTVAPGTSTKLTPRF